MKTTPDASAPKPLVSFLIVAYNAGSYLLPSVTSALQQKGALTEVILVDNASTDGSVEHVAGLIGTNGAFRVVRSKSNLGPAGGAVLGLDHCCGDFIARLDADDVALPGRIAEQLRYLLRHPEKDAVGADVVKVDADGSPRGLGLSLRSEFLRRRASKWDIGCLHTTLLVRRSALKDRFYNPTLFAGEDFEWIEWLARRGKLGVVPKALCLYRQHDFSITRRLGNVQRLSGCELRMRIGEAANSAEERDRLARTDFSFLLTDNRLGFVDEERAHIFERRSRKERNWLAAAYFASIGRRWPRVGVWLIAAVIGGAPWREALALGLCRTLWPAWQRTHDGFFWIFRHVASRKRPDKVEEALLLAGRLNALKGARRRKPSSEATPLSDLLGAPRPAGPSGV